MTEKEFSTMTLECNYIIYLSLLLRVTSVASKYVINYRCNICCKLTTQLLQKY